MSQGRTLRRDAAENRARILDAAEAVFAAKGPTAATEEVAERAGVGIATVFRHFGTKDELLTAVLRRVLDGMAADVRARLDDPDPGAAFFQALERAVEQGRLKRILAAGLSNPIEMPRKREWLVPLREALGALLPRAQESGAVRGDIGVDEVMVVLAAAANASQYVAQDREVERRSVAVMLDGLRPE